MKCQAKGCQETVHVQYVIVDGATEKDEYGIKSTKGKHKEFFCQKHLRRRILMLELMKLSNDVRKEIKGWW